jgi:rSAM/selenodomain-associated transferase 1
MTETRILIFAKAPVPGKVKTRLIPAIGAEAAAILAGWMLQRTALAALDSEVGSVELCMDPPSGHPHWMGQVPLDVIPTPQGDGDLGQRLARAAQRVLATGERVMLIGTDCPELDKERLAAAAAALDRHDAVIHPAHDGGYALLGLTKFDPSLFEDIAWSGPNVAADTIARVKALGWSLHVAETLRDIDVPADLP